MPEDVNGASPRRASALLGGFARGVGWTYVSLLATGLSQLVIIAWSVRRIGTGQYGLYAVAMAVADLLVVLDYGLGLSVTHGTARADALADPEAREDGRRLVHGAHCTYVVLAALTLALTPLVVLLVGRLGVGRAPYAGTAVAVLGLSVAVTLATAVLPAVAVGLQRFSARSGANVAAAGVRVAVALAGVGRFGLAALAVAHLAGVLTERAVLARRLRREAAWLRLRPSRPSRASLRKVTAFAAPLIVLNVSGQLFAVSDIFVVGVFVGSSAVALYQVGTLFPLQLRNILMMGYNVSYPALAGTDDERSQEEVTAFLGKVFSFVGGAGFGVAVLLREDIVELILGRSSGLAEGVFVVFCAVGLADLIVHGFSSLLVVRGWQALMAKAVSVELPLNLVLTVALVWAVGAVGAAVATFAVVLVMDFVVFPWVARGKFSEPVPRIVARSGLAPATLGAGTAMAAALVSLPVGSVVARLAVAVTVAGAASSAVGLLLLRGHGRRMLRAALAPRAATHPSATVAVPTSP